MIQHPMGHSRIHLKMSNLGGFYRKVSVSSAIHLANDQRRKDRYHISSLKSSKRPIICFYTSNAMTVTLIIICSPIVRLLVFHHHHHHHHHRCHRRGQSLSALQASRTPPTGSRSRKLFPGEEAAARARGELHL